MWGRAQCGLLQAGRVAGEVFEYVVQNGFIAREVEYPYNVTGV